jgi:hypothetical protein
MCFRGPVACDSTYCSFSDDSLLDSVSGQSWSCITVSTVSERSQAVILSKYDYMDHAPRPKKTRPRGAGGYYDYHYIAELVKIKGKFVLPSSCLKVRDPSLIMPLLTPSHRYTGFNIISWTISLSKNRNSCRTVYTQHTIAIP